MKNIGSADIIGIDTCFAYIYVNMGPFAEASFYVHSNDPSDIVAHLFKNYLICLTDSLVEGDWINEADSEDVASMMEFIIANGHESELKPIMDLIHETPEKASVQDLKNFGKKLLPLVEALDGAMDFTVCANIIELLQFFRQYDPDVSIEELFDERLEDAKLDCQEMK